LYSRGIVDILKRGDRALSGVIFRVSAGFLVGALILLALSLYLSDYYLEEQQRLSTAGDMRGAMEQVRTAERLDPFSPDPLQAEALLLQQQGRNQEAAEALEEATRRDPRNYTPYMLLGFLQMNRLNDYEAATETFQEALEINPNATLVSTALAQALLRQGEFEEARRVYEKLREEGRISTQSLYNLGRIYVRTGEPERGMRTLEETRRRAVLALEVAESSERPEAAEFLESVDLSIADALVVQGQYAEAREIVAESDSEQAPAILALLDNDPELYRESVKNSEIY
jgi:pentatricopeptide repeat protein